MLEVRGIPHSCPTRTIPSEGSAVIESSHVLAGIYRPKRFLWHTKIQVHLLEDVANGSEVLPCRQPLLAYGCDGFRPVFKLPSEHTQSPRETSLRVKIQARKHLSERRLALVSGGEAVCQLVGQLLSLSNLRFQWSCRCQKVRQSLKTPRKERGIHDHNRHPNLMGTHPSKDPSVLVILSDKQHPYELSGKHPR